MVNIDLESKFVLILIAVLYVLGVYLTNAMSKAEVLQWVKRRRGNDYYKYINSSESKCDKNTYLICERQCVNDQELFEGCGYMVIPHLIQSSHLIAFLDSNRPNITDLVVDNRHTPATFTFSGTDMILNSSNCSISSLEVYQGRKKTIEISHEGFSVSDNGGIKINKGKLAYRFEDFIGELYRMIVFCMDTNEKMLHEGCLFFKIIGTSYYNNTAKFNDSLQETFNDSDDCVTTVTVTPAITVTPTAAIVPTAMTITPDISVDLKSGNKTQEVGSISYYVLAVLGGGIMILSLSVMILCIAIGIHWQVAKRKSIGDQSIDVQHRDNDYDRDNTEFDTVTPSVLPEILSEETEHVYAVLEQTQLQQPPTVIQLLDETTEQDQQSHLERVPSGRFQDVTNQTGQKSRSATWTSAQQSMVGAKRKNENLELVHIYDDVPIVREERSRVTTDIDDGSSYPANYRKHSLPANLQSGVNHYSNTSQDCPVSNGSDTKPDESIPIYSRPDMNKKREGHQKKKEQKEQEERKAALQRVSGSSSPPLPQLTERGQKNEQSTATDSGFVFDGQQQTDIDLEFGKHHDGPNSNPDDNLFTDNNECLYDMPTSLELVPKKSKNTVEGSMEEDKL